MLKAPVVVLGLCLAPAVAAATAGEVNRGATAFAPAGQTVARDHWCSFVLAGKDATADGSVMMSYSNDWSANNYQYLQVVPAPDPSRYRFVKILTMGWIQEGGINERQLGVSYYDTNRLWGAFDLVAPSLDLQPSMPFAARPVWMVPDRPICYSTTDHSAVWQLRSRLPEGVGGVVWVAPSRPCSSTFVPFYTGITSVPAAWTGKTAARLTGSAQSAYLTDYSSQRVTQAYNLAMWLPAQMP